MKEGPGGDSRIVEQKRSLFAVTSYIQQQKDAAGLFICEIEIQNGDCYNFFPDPDAKAIKGALPICSVSNLSFRH